MLDCDGEVEPEENFELRLEIHDPRLPTGFGALFGNESDPAPVPLLMVVSPLRASLSIGELEPCVSDLAGAEAGTFGEMGEGLSGDGGFSISACCDVFVSESLPGLSQETDETERQREGLLSGQVRWLRVKRNRAIEEVPL